MHFRWRGFCAHAFIFSGEVNITPEQQGPVYKHAMCLFTHAFLWWDAERQLSPHSACFGFHALRSNSHSTACGTRPGKTGDKEETRNLWGTTIHPSGNKHTTFQWSIPLDSTYTLKETRTREQTWAQVADQPYVTAAMPYSFVGLGLCKLACSEPEPKGALEDSMRQPPLPNKLHG